MTDPVSGLLETGAPQGSVAKAGGLLGRKWAEHLQVTDEIGSERNEEGARRVGGPRRSFAQFKANRPAASIPASAAPPISSQLGDSFEPLTKSVKIF